MFKDFGRVFGIGRQNMFAAARIIKPNTRAILCRANSRRLAIEALEDRRMLAVGSFQRLNSGGAVADTGSGARVNYVVAQSTNFDTDQMIAGATSSSNVVSSGDGQAHSTAQASATIPTPIGGSIAVPQVTAAMDHNLQASANNSFAQAQGSIALGQATASFQYNADPNYSQNLIFNGFLFVSGSGGWIYTGDGIAGGYVVSRAQINDLYIQVAMLSNGTWQFSSNIPGYEDPQAYDGTTPIHIPLTFEITDGAEVEFTARSGSESNAQVNGTGLAELIVGGSAGASGWVDGESSVPLAGDFNRDGVVNAGDYRLFAAGSLQADENFDGVVDADDFDIWAANETGVIIVSNPNDELDTNYSAGDLSLREALAIAANASHPGTDTIVFAPTVTNITLTYDGPDWGSAADQLDASNVDILGPGADKLTIDGDGVTRVLQADTSTIEGVTITGGNASEGGGILGQNLVIRESRITGNYGGRGGGIESSRSLELVNSEISGNIAGSHGGGMYLYGTPGNCDVSITNCTISDNHATNSWFSAGGGIAVVLGQDRDGGDVNFSISNSTISGNSAKYGGGLFVNAHTYYESTIYAQIVNTIIAGNTDLSNNPKDVDFYESYALDSSHDLIGYDPSGFFSWGTANIRGTSSAIDARLAPLDFYGGKTRTQALLFDSLAIDAGDNDFVDNDDGLAADQRGLPRKRIVDWDDNSTATVDIGAFELALGELYS